MLTKNGKYVFGTTFTLNTGANVILKTLQGTIDSNPKSSLYNNMKLYVGNGTTIPTVDDYNMESKITTLTELGHNRTAPSGISDNFMLTASTTFKNNTNEAITVSELGFITGYNDQYPDSGSFLLAHELIEPVTIQPNETYAFTMIIG